MIVYKRVLEQLAEAGHSTYEIGKKKTLSQGTLTRIRNNQSISLATLDVICKLTGRQPGELIEYKEDGDAE